MKLSFSRAAWIQWLALAVDWNGLVTCTQSHLSEPSSRSRIIFVMWLPTLGLSVFGGSFQSSSLRARCFGVVDDHVRGQSVGEGADLARRAAGRRLAGQREGAVAGLGLLAGQQVHHVGLLVDPGAADVLVEAHGPERDDLAVRVDVVVGELLELLLEGVERLVGVALGQLGDEVEGVGLERRA